MIKQNIKYRYIFEQEYNPVYVNGAYGGLGPKGEIVINFYCERHPLLKSHTFELLKDSKLGKEIERDPNDPEFSFVRFVPTGIILNLETAKEIHNWLGNHIKILESQPTTVKLESN